MTLPRALVLISAAVFDVTGLGYLLVPGLLLSVVGIESASTSDFLLRTQGVALLGAAGLLWAARGGSPTQTRVTLFVLAAYYVGGSLVDMTAFAEGVVGWASVPSAALRIAVGVVCVLSAARIDRATSAG